MFLVSFFPLSTSSPCPPPYSPASPCHDHRRRFGPRRFLPATLCSHLSFCLLAFSSPSSLSSKLCINAGPETEKTQHSDLQMASGFITRRFPPTPPPSSSSEHPRCPRCNSQETKFCYYNNYNLAQPRHFCKSCRRYWTLGGTIRNIPVGGTSRRSYLAASASSTSSYSSSGISKRRRSDRPMSNSSSTASSSATASSSSTMVLVDVHHHGGVHPPPQPISLVAPSNDEQFVPRTFGGLLTEPIPSGFRLGLGIEETGFSQGRSPWALFGEETYFNHVGVGVSIGRQPPPPAPSQQQQHQMVGGGIGDYGSDLFFDAWPISGGYGGGHFTWPDVTVDATPVKRIE